MLLGIAEVERDNMVSENADLKEKIRKLEALLGGSTYKTQMEDEESQVLLCGNSVAVPP